jgi:hypothetical protein
MQVDQLIDRVGAPRAVVRDVGRMQYVVSTSHQHWHYLGFDRYELRRADRSSPGRTPPLVADHKTGFCLGDRYRTTGHFRAPPPARPAITGRCGLRQPDLLHVREGISVGYGDDYNGFLEGQQLPLDGLPAGRYVLVHRVNGDRKLKERSYANNAASVLLDLRWVRGIPSLNILATCPDTARCDRLTRGATTLERT